jgi:hypothetical protein
MPQCGTRLLILVVAYNAEATLAWVLDRIPEKVFVEFDTEVLVIDDASSDRTFPRGGAYRTLRPDVPLRVLRNTANQGYGGNQKIGYSYAIAEGFDLVALIHGDGQYAPEELPRLLGPLHDGEADAVHGSRMMVRGGARRGGMPLYKYVGNRVLTTAQNTMLRTGMSEFHSGYRIYSVSSLREIHYLLNSDGFTFDTEVTLQLLNAGARIIEMPIPTYYGDEICRVNGIRYAADVLRATAANTLHRSGVLQQRRLDPVLESHDLKLDYPSSHSWGLAAIPARGTVIDIGSGHAGIATELARKGCRVAAVAAVPLSVPDPGVAVHVQDLDAGDYQYLLLLDVIEHLRSPEVFLDRLRAQFDGSPKRLVLTTPNIAFVAQRVMLAAGQFNYNRSGILDRGHTRLFTFRTVRHLLRDAGFRVLRTRGVPAPFPKALGDNAFSRWLIRANLFLIRISKTLFSYQIFVEAESTPDMAFRLRDTRASEVR